MNTQPSLPSAQAYDVIGDIHGHAALLRSLLARLGYLELGASWKHPCRKAIFVGDFIDRGPAIPETLAIVHGMVSEGSAFAVMGNHELDALRFDLMPTRYSHLKGQLGATHTQFRGRETEWQSYLAWFRTLPLALDFGVLRVVHACWNDDAVNTLEALSLPFDDDVIRLLVDETTQAGRAAEVLTNGVRLTLPGDLFVLTHRGVPLNWMRSKWWIPSAGKFYDDLAFPDLDVVPRELVVLPKAIPTTPIGLYDGYPPSAPPVFFGHYSLPPQTHPRPQSPNAVCVDYSAWKGGHLVAYRWNGEQELTNANFT